MTMRADAGRRPARWRRARRAGCLRCPARRGWRSSSSVPSRSWPAQTTRLCATVRKGRPSASKCAVVGVSAWAAALLGGAPVRACPSAPPMRCACQVCQGAAGWRQSCEVARRRSRAMSGSVRGSPVWALRGAHGVVDVVGGLLPGVEDHLLAGVVRVQRGDDALDRVVEQHRADADRARRTRSGAWR